MHSRSEHSQGSVFKPAKGSRVSAALLLPSLDPVKIEIIPLRLA